MNNTTKKKDYFSSAKDNLKYWISQDSKREAKLFSVFGETVETLDVYCDRNCYVQNIIDLIAVGCGASEADINRINKIS
jgi:hypothetical protein